MVQLCISLLQTSHLPPGSNLLHKHFLQHFLQLSQKAHFRNTAVSRSMQQLLKLNALKSTESKVKHSNSQVVQTAVLCL